MYRIMIVDDEKTIREGIARGNPWADWGFEVAAVCKNGIEAVQQTKISPPDVILSDIRMPGMDGVELMTYMREHYPQIKLIILSGYKDFEYLNMSIKNQVKEYLLKPTDPDEFEQLFRRLRDELDEQKEKEAAYIRYQIEKNLALLLQQDSEAADRSLAFKELQQAQQISITDCRVVICRLDYRYQYESEEFYSLRKIVTELCNTIPAELQRYFWIYKEQFLTGIISNGGRETPVILAAAFLAEVQAAASQQLGISISFGVSSPCRAAEIMRECFAQAQHCVGQRVFMGPGTIFFDEYKAAAGRPEPERIFDHLQLEKYLMTQDEEAIAEYIGNSLGRFRGMYIADIEQFYHVCGELYFYVLRLCQRTGLVFDEILAAAAVKVREIQEPDNIEEAIRIYTDLLIRISRRIQEVMKDRKEINGTGRLIREYVDKAYLDNSISLEYLAAQTGRSPAYISRVFKEETGCGFSEYVTKKRMEKSLQLLGNPRLKVYEVAARVGYADVSNYIRSFKKTYGMSPTDYRNCGIS